MQCPRDEGTLIRETYEGNVVVDRCTSCAGIWLDSGELKDIQETIEHDYSHELGRIDTVSAAYALARQKTQANVECPKCASALHAKEYGYCSQILIDRCLECGGVWLDAGELQALEKFFETSQVEQIVEEAQAEETVSRGFFASLWAGVN